MQGRQAHLILDLFEQKATTSPKCLLQADQELPDITVDVYKRTLQSLCDAIPLAISDAPEGYEAFINELVNVLYSRQVLSTAGTGMETLHTIEDVMLHECFDQFEEIYKSMTVHVEPVRSPEQEPQQHAKHESAHDTIVRELLAIFSACLSKTIRLHANRYLKLKEMIEQSLSVREAFLIIYNAKHNKYDTQAEQAETKETDNLHHSWFGGLFSSASSVENKPILSSKPNQTWFGGFFRRFVYDDLENVYTECFKVFDRMKDHAEVKSVLEEFSDFSLENTKRC